MHCSVDGIISQFINNSFEDETRALASIGSRYIRYNNGTTVERDYDVRKTHSGNIFTEESIFSVTALYPAENHTEIRKYFFTC